MVVDETIKTELDQLARSLGCNIEYEIESEDEGD